MQDFLRKTYFFLLCAFVFTITGFGVELSFTNAKPNNVFIILLALVTIILFFTGKKEARSKFSIWLLLFIAVYLIHVVGLLRTDNSRQGFFELEKKISLFIFPLVLFYSPKLSRYEIKVVLLSFVTGCLLAAIICISIATSRFISLNDMSVFYYHELSLIVGMHAVYLSMYFCLAMSILVFLFLDKVKDLRLIQRILLAITLFIFGACIVLLAGRLHILLLVIAIMTYGAYSFMKKNSIIVSLLKTSIIGLVIIGFVFLFPRNRERFKEAINYNNEYGLDRKWGENQMRPLIWSCALQSIKKAPLFGNGIGDVQDDLQQCYIQNDYVSLLIWEPVRFNAHNQYLETTISLGITGLLILIVSMGGAVTYALKHQNTFYSIFILLFAISCITESMLERQNGIVFFAFFNSFLFFNNLSEKIKTGDVPLNSTM